MAVTLLLVVSCALTSLVIISSPYDISFHKRNSYHGGGQKTIPTTGVGTAVSFTAYARAGAAGFSCCLAYCRFFLGGVSSLRGFQENHVGPSESRLGSFQVDALLTLIYPVPTFDTCKCMKPSGGHQGCYWVFMVLAVLCTFSSQVAERTDHAAGQHLQTHSLIHMYPDVCPTQVCTNTFSCRQGSPSWASHTSSF